MYIANSRATTKKVKKCNWYAKKGEKTESYKMLNENQKKGRKSVEDKNRNKEQGQQIENSNKYRRY